MNAILTIENSIAKEEILFENIEDKNHFCCTKDNVNYEILIENDKKMIIMDSSDHKTNVVIDSKNKSYIEIIDDNGAIKLDIKVLANKENNDMINLVYDLDKESCNINIKYL